MGCSLLNGTDDELWGFEKNPYDGSLKNNKKQRFGDQNYETYYIYSKKIPNHRLYSDSRGRCAYISKWPKITQMAVFAKLRLDQTLDLAESEARHCSIQCSAAKSLIGP